MNAPAKKKPAAPFRRIDGEFWSGLLVVMREVPQPSITKAAARMGSTKKTVTRLMTVGVPGTAWGHRPMREVLAAEREAAVVKAQNVAEVAAADEQAAIRAASINTRSEELKLVRFARANVQALLAVTTHVTKGSLAIAKKLSVALEKPGAMNAGHAMLLLVRAGSIVQKAVYAAETIVALERMVGGDPKDALLAGQESEDADDMSDDEAIAELRRAADVYGRMTAQGLSVITGGAGVVGRDVKPDNVQKTEPPEPEKEPTDGEPPAVESVEPEPQR